MNPSRSRILRIAVLGTMAVFAPGCDNILGSLSRKYTGPEPSRQDITGETVIVRTVDVQPQTGIQFFYVDRERYRSSAPHDINRVVEVTSRDVQPEVTRMQLKAGDRIRISTKFLSISEAGDLGRYFPDWPYDRYDEYPIGFHALTKIERVQP